MCNMISEGTAGAKALLSGSFPPQMERADDGSVGTVRVYITKAMKEKGSEVRVSTGSLVWTNRTAPSSRGAGGVPRGGMRLTRENSLL